MRIPARVDDATKVLARNVGLEEPMRRVRRALDSPQQRRGARDDDHFHLLLAFLLRESDSCIDVGANRGDILQMMVDRAPLGKHIAFEPVPALCAKLARRFPQVDVRQVALSNTTGTRSFVQVTSLPSRSGFIPVQYPGKQHIESIQVDVASLDSVLPSGYVPRLIKIDVEGAEVQVLEGAMTTINEHRPIVAFECQKITADYYNTCAADVYDLLVSRAQLRIFDLEGVGPYSLDRLREAYALGIVFNFLAIP